MRLQYNLRALFCAMLALAELSVWQRERVASFIASIAAAWQDDRPSEAAAEASLPIPPDEAAIALREFQIEQGIYYAERARAEAAMNRAEALSRYIQTHRDDPAAARAALEALRALRADSPPPAPGSGALSTDVPGLGDL